MTIRQASQKDANVINQLLTQLGYPCSQEFALAQLQFFESEGHHVLVCETGGIVVGFSALHWFSMFHSRGYVGRITAMCVSEDVRDQGIGGLLLIESENFLQRKGCVSVEVTSNLARLMTHRFYLKHGYAEDSRRFIKKI